MMRPTQARTFILSIAVTASALSVPVAAASAQRLMDQSHRVVTVGLAGGFAQGAPMAPVNTIGYSAAAMLDFKTPVRPIRLRTEGSFASWGEQRDNLWTATASLVGTLPLAWPAAPYLLVGGGGYVTQGMGVSPGWTLGAGLTIPVARHSLFVESRIHAFDLGRDKLERSGPDPMNGTKDRWRYTYTPLTLGIRF